MSVEAKAAPKLLFFVSEDWYFLSHRLSLAIAAKEAGYDVCVVTRIHAHGDEIKGFGLRVIPFAIARAKVNPIVDLSTLIRLAILYRQERPTIVHHVALKPVILGSISASMSGVKGIVNALAGLGYVFSSPGNRAVILRFLVKLSFKVLFRSNRVRVIVQNEADRRTLERSGVSREKIVLIAGSGIDTEKFTPKPEPSGEISVAMVSRMLWPKGVGELVEACRILKESGRKIRVILVGGPDPENPLSIDESALNSWSNEGLIEWWGLVPNQEISNIWHQSHIGVLPSYYGEGVPKALLEAAACGRPLIASDTPGCRDVVVHEETGLLVPPRDSKALADAIISLAENPELRARLGYAARVRVETHFSIRKVIAQTLSLYESVLGSA